MDFVIHLDTMYLVAKYPKLDVFQKWYSYAEGVEYRKLKEGIRVGDFVVRGGAAGYKFSLWQNDARLFLTDQVDEKIGDGKGAGIWIQLGPRFLIEHTTNLKTAVSDLLKAIGVKRDYQIKITRIDIAIDLLGVDMKEQDINLWQQGWVGRSKVSDLHFNSRTGDLETIYIGSRSSPIYLRIYDKVAQATKEGDIEYWIDIWKGFNGLVTRIEWEVKPNDGNFGKDLKDLETFNGYSIIELLNYLINWGRLCIPNLDDSNNRRWKDAPLWEKIRGYARLWSDGVDWPMSRHGKEFHGISLGYIKFLSGALSGGMAHLNLEKPSMIGLIEGLGKYGEPMEYIQQKAERKARIFAKI